MTQLKFKKLQATDLANYKRFYKLRHNRTCDSVTLESFIWKDYYNVQAAIVKRENEEIGLVWLMSQGDEYFSAMPLCKEEDLEYCFNIMVEYFNNELGKPFVINLADEEAVKCLDLDKNKFLVKEEEDLKDYIYDGEKLRTLSGRKLHKKKNHYNSFVKKYEGRYLYRALTCLDRDEIFRFLNRWREGKGDDVEEHLDPEVEGIHSVLVNCHILDIKMAGVFIDGQLEALTIGSINTMENMAVIHIEKANIMYDGLYQFINKEFLCNEFKDVEIVNREDDLGIEGLRKAKESYCPVDYARKYYIKQLDFA